LKKKILITGASGLLGNSLVDQFTKKGFYVLAQYHKKPLPRKKNCLWLFADFSNLAGIRIFLEENKSHLQECTHLVNNYGPITVKATRDLKSEDFINDYYHNVITTFEISTFLIKNSNLQSVVNIGFEYVGIEKIYKKVLAYALAKNSLFLLTKSLSRAYPRIHFNLVSPVTIKGPKVILKNSPTLPAEKAARKIFPVITSSLTAQNVLVKMEKENKKQNLNKSSDVF